jgi:hypothetical protein
MYTKLLDLIVFVRLLDSSFTVDKRDCDPTIHC